MERPDIEDAIGKILQIHERQERWARIYDQLGHAEYMRRLREAPDFRESVQTGSVFSPESNNKEKRK